MDNNVSHGRKPKTVFELKIWSDKYTIKDYSTHTSQIGQFTHFRIIRHRSSRVSKGQSANGAIRGDNSSALASNLRTAGVAGHHTAVGGLAMPPIDDAAAAKWRTECAMRGWATRRKRSSAGNGSASKCGSGRKERKKAAKETEGEWTSARSAAERNQGGAATEADAAKQSAFASSATPPATSGSVATSGTAVGEGVR
jgi:hypothetical protein